MSFSGSISHLSPHRPDAIATFAGRQVLEWLLFRLSFLCYFPSWHACLLLILGTGLQGHLEPCFLTLTESRLACPPSSHSVSVHSSLAFITSCNSPGHWCVPHLLPGFYFRIYIRAGMLSILTLRYPQCLEQFLAHFKCAINIV